MNAYENRPMRLFAFNEELPPLTTLKPLSDVDRDLFLSVLDGPPKPATESLKKAMAVARP